MAETLGSLCDKLTVLKLKEWHTNDPDRLEDLALQSERIRGEIDAFLGNALAGRIPLDALRAPAHKVVKGEGNRVGPVEGDLGALVDRLARTNCALWHEQEKVYEFEKVPPGEKDRVVKRLARLNLERNECIDAIDRELARIAGKGGVKIP